MPFCDLHIHSTASDGTAAPDQLAQLARNAGLDAIALTDHDTTAGVAECADACRKTRVRFAPGIELSADPAPVRPGDSAGRRGTLHILGLFIRHDHPGLAAIQERLREARAQRNPQIIAKLNDLGVRIDYEEVVAEAGGAIVGRPHIAQVLLKKGYVKSMQDAFARYLGEGAAAYARKDRLRPADAIAAIHDAGGLAMLAHPVQLRCADEAELTHLVVKLKQLGLDGIETRHSDHLGSDVERFEKMAAEMEMLTTGGSDYHGARKSIALGSQRVPLEVYERLAEEATKRRSDGATKGGI